MIAILEAIGLYALVGSAAGLAVILYIEHFRDCRDAERRLTHE